MNGAFGLLSTGFVPKRLTDIEGQMVTSLQADFGAGFQALPETPEGQMLIRISEQAADLWEGLEMIYLSFSPQTASGTALDDRLAMTNNFRIPETRTVVNGVVITGTPGTVIPADFQLYIIGDSSKKFTISAGTVIPVIDGFVTVSFVADEAGPVPAPAGLLVNQVTPIAGISSIVAATAGQLGTYAETDSAFRMRAAQEKSKSGTGTYTGLKKYIMENVADVSLVHEFTNDFDYVDSKNLAPHSVWLIVVGGIDQEIGNAIFTAKGAGIQTNGSTSVTVVDSEGISHVVKFSRLTQTPIYVIVNLTVNFNPSIGPVYPGGGNALVASAVLAYGATFAPGQSISEAGLAAAAFIPGVLTASVLFSTSPGPTGSTEIDLPVDQIAQFSSANLTVNS